VAGTFPMSFPMENTLPALLADDEKICSSYARSQTKVQVADKIGNALPPTQVYFFTSFLRIFYTRSHFLPEKFSPLVSCTGTKSPLGL
jgi:hypothetical protein